ncbi:hypothetical protein [Piscirickettsia salmonis]|uniref:hypothetical protein n=1 Tax=Piscirickettsia salmonis TaxID=1238 RepID=UPI0012BAE125|nr:hypothetical protein [Piscirickettsia salmonis]QGP41357.1 hypothetical protein Psal182_03567 [Piscirickettsia salmonis]
MPKNLYQTIVKKLCSYINYKKDRETDTDIEKLKTEKAIKLEDVLCLKNLITNITEFKKYKEKDNLEKTTIIHPAQIHNHEQRKVYSDSQDLIKKYFTDENAKNLKAALNTDFLLYESIVDKRTVELEECVRELDIKIKVLNLSEE